MGVQVLHIFSYEITISSEKIKCVVQTFVDKLPYTYDVIVTSLRSLQKFVDKFPYMYDLISIIQDDF